MISPWDFGLLTLLSDDALTGHSPSELIDGLTDNWNVFCIRLHFFFLLVYWWFLFFWSISGLLYSSDLFAGSQVQGSLKLILTWERVKKCCSKISTDIFQKRICQRWATSGKIVLLVSFQLHYLFSCRWYYQEIQTHNNPSSKWV